MSWLYATGLVVSKTFTFAEVVVELPAESVTVIKTVLVDPISPQSKVESDKVIVSILQLSELELFTKLESIVKNPLESK